MIDEKIKEKIEQHCRNPILYSEEQAVKDLKQLFIQELKACLPEKKNFTIIMTKDGRDAMTVEEWGMKGFNEAIDKAEQNINKLSEEGVEK